MTDEKAVRRAARREYVAERKKRGLLPRMTAADVIAMIDAALAEAAS